MLIQNETSFFGSYLAIFWGIFACIFLGFLGHEHPNPTHYRVHRSPPLGPIMNPFRPITRIPLRYTSLVWTIVKIVSVTLVAITLIGTETVLRL
jgi:hypothetical protein